MRRLQLLGKGREEGRGRAPFNLLNDKITYVTISVPEDVKREKGGYGVGEFLMHLYTEFKRVKKLSNFERLRELLGEEDLKKIEDEAREFRRGFKLKLSHSIPAIS